MKLSSGINWIHTDAKEGINIKNNAIRVIKAFNFSNVIFLFIIEWVGGKANELNKVP